MHQQEISLIRQAKLIGYPNNGPERHTVARDRANWDTGMGYPRPV